MKRPKEAMRLKVLKCKKYHNITKISKTCMKMRKKHKLGEGWNAAGFKDIQYMSQNEKNHHSDDVFLHNK